MSTYYTYVYLDVRKPGTYTYGNYIFAYEPFYVGKGTKNRYKEHLWEANADTNRNKNPHKKHIILKIRDDTGIDPVIVFPHANLTAEEAILFEKELISCVGRHDLGTGPLVNLTAGGDGMLGRKQPDSQKQKISAALKGKPKTERHKESMRRGNITKRKNWVVTSPTGEVTVVNTLREFCDERGLDFKEMQKVAAHHAGKTKFNRAAFHRGWKCEYS